jgi:hypothetical protein
MFLGSAKNNGLPASRFFTAGDFDFSRFLKAKHPLSSMIIPSFRIEASDYPWGENFPEANSHPRSPIPNSFLNDDHPFPTKAKNIP